MSTTPSISAPSIAATIAAPSVAATIGIGPETPRSHPKGSGTGTLPAPTTSGQGRLTTAGAGSGALAGITTGGIGLLDQMVADVQNAGFAVYASYDYRKNVRLDTDGVSTNGVDDERDSTSSGQLVLPVAGGVLCGNYVGLSGATQATFTIWAVVQAASGVQTLISRARNGSSQGQFSLRLNGQKIEWLMGNNTAVVTQATTSSPAPSNAILKVTLTIDTVTAITHVYTQTYDFVTPWAAEVDEPMAAYPAFPAAFSSPVVTNLCIGGQVSSSNGGSGLSPFIGGILRARVRPGIILNAAQRAADTLFPNTSDPNWVAPALAYEMQGSVANTGLAGSAFDGVLPSAAFLCSDDVRWGPTLSSGGLTNRMIWNALTGFGTNGVNTFARCFGGLLAKLPSATYRILVIGDPPSNVGTWVNTSQGANTSDNLLALQSPAAGQLQVQWKNGTPPVATLVPGAGVRAILARLVATNQVAILDGNAAEVVGAVGSSNGFVTPVELTLFATGAATPTGFAPDGTIKKVMILKATTGTTADLQALMTKYGVTFFDASV